MAAIQTITPCLWFDGEAEEAARFYTSIFPDSRIDKTFKSSIDTPGGEAGSTVFVIFTLAGQSFQAVNGGPHEQFNDSISFSVACEDQAEVDRYWDALTADGGRPVQCGWLKDKYGVSWQIVPRVAMDMLGDPDPERVKRYMAAMMSMVKLDIAALQKAYEGR